MELISLISNRKLRISLFMVVLFFITFGCNSVKDDGLYAVFNTNKGKFICKLYYDKTPVTVGNFVGLVEGTRELTDPSSGQKFKKPFYNGLIFHRVIKDFMIQGGCPNGNGTGRPGKDYWFVDEFDPALKHDSQGVLSMANSGPNSNGSQFFITLAPQPHLDNKHTVFGKVVSGLDVVNKIGSVKTDKEDKPYDEVFIKTIKILRIGDAAKSFDAEAAFAKNQEVYDKMIKEQEEKMKVFLESQLKVPLDKIVETDIGLKYYIKRKGSGPKPVIGDFITAHYTGYLQDGKKFDSSHERNEPFKFQVGVGRVIAGWDEALINMQIGEKRVIILPYYLAYGERGHSIIPPKATLIFEVELLKISKQ
ncbi:MAG: peptidylprolyl isomerase [Spirochaetes bacterium]|nr:peptidylprolyl isomerase [Spirochaetota bacterium]